MRREWRRSDAVAMVTFLVWITLMQPVVASVCYNVACRVDSVFDVKNCAALRKCSYLVCPVENIPKTDDARWIGQRGRFNNIFSIYGGKTACAYFANKISTGDTCMTVARAVLKQLESSKFQGVDIQCDPTVNGLNQSVYVDWLREFRKRLGKCYLLSVRIENSHPSSDLVKTLNEVADVINCPNDLVVRSLLSEGCQPQKIVLDVPLTSVASCPIDYTIVRTTSTSVKCLNLYGAIMPLNYDDSGNTCGDGHYPILEKLIVLLDNDELCDFEEFMPDPRDKAQFFSCSNGIINKHRCPKGQLFDCVKKTCMPFVKITCNEASCKVVGPMNPSINSTFKPMLIPFPKSNYTPPATADFNQTEMAELFDYLQKHGMATNVRSINEGIDESNANAKNLEAQHNDVKNHLNQGSDSIHKSDDKVSSMTGALDKITEPLALLTGLLEKLTSLLGSAPATPSKPSLPLG